MEMPIRETSDLEALLAGVSLPVGTEELADYARGRDHAGLAGLIGRLPERDYESLDEVAQALVLREAHLTEPDPHDPR